MREALVEPLSGSGLAYVNPAGGLMQRVTGPQGMYGVLYELGVQVLRMDRWYWYLSKALH